jgi:hypothetical protein
MKKYSAFKLRSGNKPSPMQLSGVSPMKNDKEKQRKEKIRIEQEKRKKEREERIKEGTREYKINSAKKKRDDANQKAANDYYLKTGIEVDKYATDPEAKRLYDKMVKEYDTPPTREEAGVE